MAKFKRLPDTEFEVMKIVWANEPPITAPAVIEQLGADCQWKAPTVISFLKRLVEKGFLETEKTGKERGYYPIMKKEDYLAYETDNFIEQYHENSFFSVVNTLYGGKKISEKDLDDIIKWAEDRRE